MKAHSKTLRSHTTFIERSSPNHAESSRKFEKSSRHYEKSSQHHGKWSPNHPKVIPISCNNCPGIMKIVSQSFQSHPKFYATKCKSSVTKCNKANIMRKPSQTLEMSPRSRAKFIPQPWKHHPKLWEVIPAPSKNTPQHEKVVPSHATSSRNYAKVITKLCKLSPKL